MFYHTLVYKPNKPHVCLNSFSIPVTFLTNERTVVSRMAFVWTLETTKEKCDNCIVQALEFEHGKWATCLNTPRGKIWCFKEMETTVRGFQSTCPDWTSYHLPLLPVYAWLGSNCEYGAQLKLMDAICLGKQSYLHQYFWIPLLSLFLSALLSREKSVSVISDIYSHDGSWGEHAQHSKGRDISGVWTIQRHQGIEAFVFINCFRRHCLSHSLPSLCLFLSFNFDLKDKYVYDFCHHLCLRHLIFAKYRRTHLFFYTHIYVLKSSVGGKLVNISLVRHS